MSDLHFVTIGEPAVKLVEECAELIHVLMKAERFGWLAWHPDDPLKRTNKRLTLDEIQDVRRACDELKEALDHI